MVQVASADVQAECDHPVVLTKAQRQKIARDKYRKSSRGQARRKWRLAGIPKHEINRMIRAEWPARAPVTSLYEVQL